MLTHLDSQGRASMVDVTDKAVTAREAVAEARVRMLPQTEERKGKEKGKRGIEKV